MKVSDIMTSDPACGVGENSLVEIAKLMKDCDCGALPILENEANRKPAGMITDRDIVIRALAEGKDPFLTQAEECMTPSVISVRPDDDIDECIRLMEKNKVRRIIVVDSKGAVAGLVTQGQIALATGKAVAGEVLQEISRP
ncbi:MAG: putative signal-transduction protein containing cAMP-binding and domain [Fibrobacteres bacterium]|nr:putative signal-transduction protein containing cAMP-binding and domain [Fibrobacterota bacterium]